MAKITVAFMREVYAMMDREEISYSRMVEMLNEEAQRKCEGNCGMNYCDTNGCMERVRIPTNPADFNEKAQEKWYEDEKTLDIISGLTGIIVLLLCILYYFLPIENQAYIHLTVGVGAGIVVACEYQVARLFNKSYIPVWIGGVLCILNLLCFLGYIK